MVQGFTGGTEVDLALPCTYDFDVTGSKYLHALRDGDVPLRLLFTGTVFTRAPPASASSRCRGTARRATSCRSSVWRDLMDQYFPNTGWLRLDHDTCGQLARYRSAHGLTTWDETVADAAAPRREEGVTA